MAAKKLQEYVKGKMSTSNVGAIHFSSNGAQDKTVVNISKFQPIIDDKDLLPKPIEQELESFNSPDQKLQFTSETPDYFGSNTPTPSSTKSSPDSKPKWGTHIEDVKKNINNAVEDAYSMINTILKEHINKPEIKPYPPDQDNPLTVDKQQPTIRTSKTMSNIDKIVAIDDPPSELSTYNKSMDNLSMDSEALDALKPHETDSVDFKWMPTPKNIKKNKSKTHLPDNDSNIPRQIQESMIHNHKFPDSKIVSHEPNQLSVKWALLIGSIVLVLPMVWLNLHLFFGFGIGIVTCFLFLFYFGIFELQTNHRIVSLPALKDLVSPSIPHIQKDNFEDRDIHATENSSFSGWMNLLFFYDINTYNINHSYVVHINIEPNKQLRIRRPKRKIARRAMWNEAQHHIVSFNSEIVVSLENAVIELLPHGLVPKRLWSKKYPIYIGLSKSLDEYSIDKSNFDIMNPKATYFYLFGRSCREKEEWFRRLSYASSSIVVDLNMWNIVQNYITRKKSSLDDFSNPLISNKQSDTHSRRSFTFSQNDDESKKVTYHHNTKEEDENQEPIIETHKWKQEKIPRLAEYVKYMSKFMPADMFLLTSEVMRLDINYVTCNPEILCINAFLGRLFWDFLRGSHWVGLLRNKIQCKLKKMHLPQFIDQLTVVDIDLGKEIPLIRKFSRPYLDSRGLWCDAEVAYTGGMSMILETKINLFNLTNQLKKTAADEVSGKTGSPEHNSEMNKEEEEHRSRSQNNGVQSNKTAAFVSSEEDSAESSSDSEESGDERDHWVSIDVSNDNGPTSTVVANSNQVGGGGSSKRIIRWVDKIARSPYFIKAADNKYIQRGMELVSNTKLMLQVEVHSVCGTLALNIPPPPSDRLWYGFRPSPILKISAKPKVGQKEISISKITDLIEKKLILEFQKLLVLPNMDDIPIPLLINGIPDKYSSNL